MFQVFLIQQCFADDTNLFYTHKNIHCLFSDVNKKLTNTNQWFVSNKLSLNVEKTKYSFFHKASKKDNIPLQLPNLTINIRKIKREESIKFIGVLLDENVTWKEHLKFIENKCANNIGLLYKAKHHLKKKCLIRIVHNKVKFEHARHLFRKNKIFSIYQLKGLLMQIWKSA